MTVCATFNKTVSIKTQPPLEIGMHTGSAVAGDGGHLEAIRHRSLLRLAPLWRLVGQDRVTQAAWFSRAAHWLGWGAD